MNSALTKLIYGSITDAKKAPFGLVNNQQRNDSIINNAGWFNSNGERLGKGDLSLTDMSNISKSIGDEMFFVLSEADSGWNMPSQLDASAPGFDYVISHISWGITSGSIIRVRDFVDTTEKVVKDKIEYTRISRKSFSNLVGSMQKKQVSNIVKKDDTLLDSKKSVVIDAMSGKLIKSQPYSPVSRNNRP